MNWGAFAKGFLAGTLLTWLGVIFIEIWDVLPKPTHVRVPTVGERPGVTPGMAGADSSS